MSDTHGIDIGFFITILSFIVFIAYLSYREMQMTRQTAEQKQRKILLERNALEKKISERTREFIASETLRAQDNERLVQLGRLSQGLFHDLMSPLTSITLNIDTLSKNNLLSKEEIDSMQRSIEASKKMKSFMESLKSIIGNQQTHPEKQESSLEHELSIVQDLLAYKARMHGVKIILNNSDDANIALHPIRLQQLFMNLISNAIDAYEMPDESGKDEEKRTVSISWKKESDDLHLFIDDNGKGMSKDNLDKAFEQSFTTKADGTGIGLMTAATIVKGELKGTISLKSSLGKGTSCSIRIPYRS